MESKQPEARIISKAIGSPKKRTRHYMTTTTTSMRAKVNTRADSSQNRGFGESSTLLMSPLKQGTPQFKTANAEEVDEIQTANV